MIQCPVQRGHRLQLSLSAIALIVTILEVSGLMLTALINTENQINEYNVCYCVRVVNFFC